jgi:hypothetical protein
VLIGALVALVAPLRARRWDLRVALAVVAAVLMVGVALMTEGGFAGNLRYVALPAALVCVLAGVGWAEVVRWALARFGRVPAVVLAAVLAAGAAPFVVDDVGELRIGWRALRAEADFYATLPAAIAKAGGRDAVVRCRPVFTGPFQVQVLAWHLKLHGGQIEIEAEPPGIVIAGRFSEMSRDTRFRLQTETRKWVVRRACAA